MKTKESPWKSISEGLVRYVPSGTYFAYYRVDGKPKKESLKTDDLATARRLLKTRRAEPAKTRSHEVTVEDLCTRYKDTLKRYSESTQLLARLFCDRFTTAFPERAISSLKSSEIEKFLSSRIDEGFSKSSYNEDLRNARKMFQLAVNDGELERNPIAHVKQMKRDQPLRDTPTEEEFEAILETVRMPYAKSEEGKHGGKRAITNDESADFIEFMGSAGVGNSETAALKWKDIDFKKKLIRLYRNKTDTGYIIPLFKAVEMLLQELWAKSDKLPESKVFAISNGKKALANACKRLQLPNYTQRSLRRLFITRCIDLGIPVTRIALWQGHRDNGATILKHYAQVFASKDAEFANRVT